MRQPEFVDFETLRGVQDALAERLLAMGSGPYDREKAEAGAVLLLMCVGIEYDQTPVEERSMHRDVAEKVFRRVGVDDEERASRLADAVACRDIARKIGQHVPNRYSPRRFVQSIADELGNG